MDKSRQQAIKADMQAGPVIAYSEQFGGVHLHRIEYGINDSIICSYPVLCRAKKHRARIYYDTERPYILIYGRRLHLDECMKTYSGMSLRNDPRGGC